MGIREIQWLVLHCCFFVGLWLKTLSEAPEVSVKFLKTPKPFSNLNSAALAFETLVGASGDACTNCTTNCRLDDEMPKNCTSREVSLTGLRDGNHTFVVCTNGSGGVGCASYKWTVDTVPPTAYITAATSFTSSPNVSVNISFSEPCTGGGGFRCSSVAACNLLAYGTGQVLPSTLNVLQPNFKFSLVVSLNTTVQYGRVILVMDKNFCTDSAGNLFTRTENSSFLVHFDRRSVFVSLRTHIPEKLLQLDSETRSVQATNNHKNLKVYLYFSEPVLNSSAQLLNSIILNQGSLSAINGESLGNRRYGFLMEDLSNMSIITVALNSTSILSRQGTPVSAVAPVTFLYDSQRPSVRLSTYSSRTREHRIPIFIKFMKPVFDFNSSHISISGGTLQSFHEVSKRSYVIETWAENRVVSVCIPENVTSDVAGNKNYPSNVLQVRHYSLPMIPLVISTFATASFAVTSVVAGLLTFSTTSLLFFGAFARSSSFLTVDPTRNLFRTACHIQVFALSGWLPVTLPIEYYELVRGLQWSIPHFHLPWEMGHRQPITGSSSSPMNPNSYASRIHRSGIFEIVQPGERTLHMPAPVYGSPLTPMEYRTFFESQNIKPEAENILNQHNFSGWRDFNRSMFWLAVIGGSLIILHGLLLLILRIRKKGSEKQIGYGGLILPRFEIFLVILSLPCISEAAAAIIEGGTSSGVVVGVLLLGVTFFLLLALFFFLSIGITFGKLLQYKEVHQVGQKFHWYQELIRVTLGPGKRGQWTWMNQPNSVYLLMFGPLFEDLRGPPKYMLSQIAGGNLPRRGDRIIASDDETEDAEAPFIQKLFGILRIYYMLIESLKRVCLGILAGTYSHSRSSRTPPITLLGITSFQLFFLVLKKPFIKKKVQLVEIISLSSQLGIFATSLALSRKEFSSGDETKIGIFMLSLFLAAFLVQIINEWYALYRQTRKLDRGGESFLAGLKTASFGLLLLIIPQKLTKELFRKLSLNLGPDSENVEVTTFGDRQGSSGSRSSGTSDKPWLKQLRELAKASFSKESIASPNDPSTSRWSEFWKGKGSGSSSVTTSTDSKSKPRGLSKDLEAIFASK